MTRSLLVDGLIKRLKSAGYDQLPTPFKVASVDFDSARFDQPEPL